MSSSNKKHKTLIFGGYKKVKEGAIQAKCSLCGEKTWLNGYGLDMQRNVKEQMKIPQKGDIIFCYDCSFEMFENIISIFTGMKVKLKPKK